MADAQQMRGWFSTPGRPGDRTIKDQRKGLGWLFANCKDKTILDVGCAEGLISMALIDAGADWVHGVEIVPEHLKMAERLRAGRNIRFEQGDLNTWRPTRRYDVVIALAVLHKLRNPTAVAATLAAAANEAVVLRLPPEHAPTIIDPRSKSEPHHIGRVMERAGFRLIEENRDGHFGEWVGVWTR